MNRISFTGLRFASLFGYCAYAGYRYPTLLEEKQDIQTYDTNAVREIGNKELTYKLKTRNEHLSEIRKTQYDVIIIGGGATGSGVALECSQRGLRNLVLDNEDFAAGASSKSTKLVHGGVRYLQQVFELSTAGGRWEKMKLVVEALKERSIFLTISQMHTSELPILIPCNYLPQALFYYSGCLLYHFIYRIFAETNTYQFKFPRIVTKDEIRLNYPHSKCEWGVLYSDGQFNDARMVQELLLTSTLQGYHHRQTSCNLDPIMIQDSNILNYAKLTQLIKDKNGQLCGVEFVDKSTQEKIKVNAKVIVNATGCFADSIRKMDDSKTLNKIVGAGGSHIVLPKKYGSPQWGYLVPATTDGRVLFIVPWLGRTLIGTTDRLFPSPVSNPTVSLEDLEWLVQSFAAQFPELRTEDIIQNISSKWCGIRPLVLEKGYTPGENIDTKEVARSHCIETSKSGLISVMGGKWTIYRKMGEETVDQIFKLLAERGHNNVKLSSISSKMKLIGDLERRLNEPQQNRDAYIKKYSRVLSKRFGISKDDAEYYIKTYGDRSFDIFKFSQQDPAYQTKVHPALPHTIGEIKYLIRYEMAQNPMDIIFRRTRLGFIDNEIIYKVYVDIMEIFAQEFNWNAKDRKKYLAEYLEQMRCLCF